MSTGEEVARLRAQIEALETVGKAENVMTKAKEAYRAKPSEKTKAAHRAASAALAESRRAWRADRTSSVSGDAFVDGEN